MKRNTLVAVVTLAALLLTSVGSASAQTLTSSHSRTGNPQAGYTPTVWQLANCAGTNCTFSNKNKLLVMLLKGHMDNTTGLLVTMTCEGTVNGRSAPALSTGLGVYWPAGTYDTSLTVPFLWKKLRPSSFGPVVLTTTITVQDATPYTFVMVSNFTLTK